VISYHPNRTLPGVSILLAGKDLTAKPEQIPPQFGGGPDVEIISVD